MNTDLKNAMKLEMDSLWKDVHRAAIDLLTEPVNRLKLNDPDDIYDDTFKVDIDTAITIVDKMVADWREGIGRKEWDTGYKCSVDFKGELVVLNAVHHINCEVEGFDLPRSQYYMMTMPAVYVGMVMAKRSLVSYADWLMHDGSEPIL